MILLISHIEHKNLGLFLKPEEVELFCENNNILIYENNFNKFERLKQHEINIINYIDEFIYDIKFDDFFKKVEYPPPKNENTSLKCIFNSLKYLVRSLTILENISGLSPDKIKSSVLTRNWILW